MLNGTVTVTVIKHARNAVSFALTFIILSNVYGWFNWFYVLIKDG